MEFPDIEAVAKEIGAAPTRFQEDGTPTYTVPIIRDPNTGKVVSDSFIIAEYLDATYPGEPALFPRDTKPLMAAFESGILNALKPLFLLQVSLSNFILNPASEKFFRTTREARFGKPIEEFSPVGPQRNADLANTKEAFASVVEWLKKSEGKFVLGDTVSYADAILAGWLVWIRATGEIWGEVATWHDGRLAAYLENVEGAGYASVN